MKKAIASDLPNGCPSISGLLCATKDDEVVEYALARTASLTLAAGYQAFLPPKEVLRAKLHELYAQLAPETAVSVRAPRRGSRS